MTGPTPPGAGGVSAGRILLWLCIALLLLAGIALYFRYGSGVPTVL